MGCSTGPDNSTASRQALVSLPGSSFEIDNDANLKVDNTLDWANVDEHRQTDTPSGTEDNSFGQGSKEDTPVPVVVSGSIPPNKSDLLHFGVWLESTAEGKRFLHVFWHRVQDPSGTTNMDFEFNQSGTLSSNGVTPERTAGDLLVQYDLANGGTNPELFLSRWVTEGDSSLCEASNKTPCWGTRVSLSAAGDATGSINTSAIPASESDGLGDVSPRTFGEASVDFDSLAGGAACVSFGSAYLKSRSSDSFTAALKDFIAPKAINVTNCGSVKLVKKDDTGALLAGAHFSLVKDVSPTGGTPGAEDTETVATCVTDSNGECLFSGVMKGEYWLVETQAPAGHLLATPPYQHVSLSAEDTVSFLFVNPRMRGALKVKKTRLHTGSTEPHQGVDFTVDGVTKSTDSNGEVCFDNLLLGDYTVTETVPDGYQGTVSKVVSVDNQASCSDNPYVGEVVEFYNTPLSDLKCVMTPQVEGGTSATITCDGLGSGGDYTNLLPGSYSCTVVIQ